MQAKPFIDVWPFIFMFDFLRYFIPASFFFLLFWVIGRNWWQHLFIQKNFPRPIQFWKEFGYSVSTVIIFSLVGFGVYSANKAGLTRVYYRVSDYGIVYTALSFVIAVVFHDFYFYWTHRFMHHKKIFKHVHKVHHESTNPSPWAAYSFHPLEALIQAVVMPIMVFSFPLHPIIISMFLAYMIVRNVIGHLGFEILPKGFTKNKWLNWNTAVTHHSLHHERFHSNYGLYFTWWDRLMKTENALYHESFDEVKSRPKVSAINVKTKKTSVATLFILISSIMLNAQTVEGRWTTYNEQTGSPLSVIEIMKLGNSIEGKVTQIFLEPYQGEDPICTKCSGERKDKKVMGMNFMWGFKNDGDSWISGKILDPENGVVYSSKLWMEDANTLVLRGYAGPFDLFYRTQTWRRARLPALRTTSGGGPDGQEGTSTQHTPFGIWHILDDNWNKIKSIVEIKNVVGELRGYVRKIFLLPHEGTDPQCTECEGELKNSKIVGMKIIWGFKKVNNKWVEGKILDPGNGTIYASTLWLIDSVTLKVRGYLGPFYRSQVWRRAP